MFGFENAERRPIQPRMVELDPQSDAQQNAPQAVLYQCPVSGTAISRTTAGTRSRLGGFWTELAILFSASIWTREPLMLRPNGD